MFSTDVIKDLRTEPGAQLPMTSNLDLNFFKLICALLKEAWDYGKPMYSDVKGFFVALAFSQPTV